MQCKYPKLSVLPSLGMSLHEYLKERHKQLRCASKCRKFHANGGLPIYQFFSLIHQMMKGVEYTHRFGAHCDIKRELTLFYIDKLIYFVLI